MIGLVAFPIFGVLALPMTIAQSEDAWSANSGMLALLVYTVIAGEAWLVAVAVLNAFLLVWTHRHSLACPPRLRPWVTHMLQGRHA